MYGKPTQVTLRDAKQRKELLGREIGQAHSLLTSLRAAGATQEDLAQLEERAPFKFFQFMTAAMRGLVDLDLPADVVNLDHNPGFSDAHDKVLVDNRLGMHKVRTDDSQVYIGDARLKFIKAEGQCSSGSTDRPSYNRLDLKPAPNDSRFDLNKCGAQWFVRHNMFCAYMRALPKDAVVFCLGTVWRQLEHQFTAQERLTPLLAMAFRHIEGSFLCEPTRLPRRQHEPGLRTSVVLNPEKNVYIAVLEVEK